MAILERDLSDADLRHYGDTGWLVRRKFFDAVETAKIAQWTDEVTAMPEVPGKQMIYYEPSLIAPGERVIQRIENFCPYHERFDAPKRGSRLARTVGQLLGAPSCLFKETISY